MCARLPVRQKEQSLEGVLKDCRFHIAEPPHGTNPLASKAAHPGLEGLVVRGASGRQYRTVKSAVNAMELKESDEVVDEAIVCFYQ